MTNKLKSNEQIIALNSLDNEENSLEIKIKDLELILAMENIKNLEVKTGSHL